MGLLGLVFLVVVVAVIFGLGWLVLQPLGRIRSVHLTRSSFQLLDLFWLTLLLQPSLAALGWLINDRYSRFEGEWIVHLCPRLGRHCRRLGRDDGGAVPRWRQPCPEARGCRFGDPADGRGGDSIHRMFEHLGRSEHGLSTCRLSPRLHIHHCGRTRRRRHLRRRHVRMPTAFALDRAAAPSKACQSKSRVLSRLGDETMWLARFRLLLLRHLIVPPSHHISPAREGLAAYFSTFGAHPLY